MTRLIVGLLGVLSTLFPDRIVDVFERLAIADSSDAAIRPWIGSAIRGEGLLVALASLVGGRAYAWLMNVTGAFGVFLLVYPDLYRRFAAVFLYERPEQIEWNDRFMTVLRLIGAFYVFLAARAFNRRQRSE